MCPFPPRGPHLPESTGVMRLTSDAAAAKVALVSMEVNVELANFGEEMNEANNGTDAGKAQEQKHLGRIQRNSELALNKPDFQKHVNPCLSLLAKRRRKARSSLGTLQRTWLVNRRAWTLQL